MIEVSIILPVYNEAACIGETLETVRQYALAHPDSQFIFIDDGSTDQSLAIMQDFVSQNDCTRIVVVSHSPNQGKGFAIKQGLKFCDGNYVCFIDSDMAYSLSHLELLVEKLQSSDIAIGARTLVSTGWNTTFRRLLSQTFNLFCRYALSLPFRDMQAGIKGFRRSVATELFGQLEIQRFAFDVELLHLARKRGFSIGEIPAEVSRAHLGTSSNFNLLRDSWEMLLNLARILLKDLRGGYG
jgi:dolichyl-phosphate beta-glucosyltransferase